MTMNSIQRDLGRIEARLDEGLDHRRRMYSEIQELKDSVKRIEESVLEAKGGRKYLYGLIVIAGSIGAALDRFIIWIK